MCNYDNQYLPDWVEYDPWDCSIDDYIDKHGEEKIARTLYDCFEDRLEIYDEELFELLEQKKFSTVISFIRDEISDKECQWCLIESKRLEDPV